MSGPKICPQCGTEYGLDQRFCPSDGTTLRLQNETGELVGTIVADRYHVLRKLGEGGMGQVYLAEHVKMGRKSALKVMNPAMVKDADAISRFNREASNASRINHPNVADVYDFGETPDGVIYLAMEFVDGPPLTKLIGEQGALPPQRAAAITRQAAEALSTAHDLGIVHRDLKPDNIMIARNRDGSDCVKIVDFGIAKAADNAAQKVTKTGLVVGTPEYMSPEQLAGDKLDGRSDIYALALVAFNMLTGRLPFPADTVQESMIMRLTDRPKRLAEMRSDIAWPEELQAVLDRALERDAAKRYQTASEFGRDFQRAVDRMTTGEASAVPMVQPGATPAAIPPTRVGPGGEGNEPVASGAQQPIGASAGASTGRSRRVPLVAAAVGILAIAGAAAGFVVLRKGEPRTETPVTRGASAPSQQGPATPQPLASGSESTPGTAGASSSPTNVSPPPSNAPRVQDVSAVLDSLEPLTDPLHNADSLSAVRALHRLDQINAFGTDAGRIRATILRAEAEMLIGRQSDACRDLRAIRADARGTNRERVATLLGTCP